MVKPVDESLLDGSPRSEVLRSPLEVLGKDFPIGEIDGLQSGQFRGPGGDHLITVGAAKRVHQEIILDEGGPNGGRILSNPWGGGMVVQREIPRLNEVT